MGLDGNTLSETIRQGWDPGILGTMTRHAALRATHVHISIITHVTPADLTDFLDDISTVNGFANPFIFIATQRVRELPNPGRPGETTLSELAARIGQAIETGWHVSKMYRSAEAERWPGGL